MSQHTMVNQRIVMMYPLQTVVTQAAYPPANNSPSVYQENQRALLHQ